MLNFAKLSCLLTLFSIQLSATETSIVKLIPPKISKETVLQKLVCTRPMREGKFNISIEEQAGKTIVNCYGHGGSGWSTLFGSVNQAIKLYKDKYPNQNLPIRIIGSGCIGLTTAIELSRLGYRVSGIYTKSLYDLPSWNAAGDFALASLKTSSEEQENLKKMGLSTFLTYRQIERGEHPYLNKESVRCIPIYCSLGIETGLEDLEAKGIIPKSELVSLDFGNGYTHQNCVKHMTYFMNTTTLMQQLIAEVKKLNIDIDLKEICSFSEIPEEVVFNCSGMGARELNSDLNMIPVVGHLVILNEDAGNEHMDYSIYIKVEQDGKEEYIYMIPKNLSVTSDNPNGLPCRGALGGTFIPHTDRLSLTDLEQLNQIEFKRMLDRNSQFFHGHHFMD